MASVNITKCHGSAAASILAHNHRHDGKDVQYRNEHIDKGKTASNSYRYFKGQDPAATSKDEYQRLRARVEEIDKAEPPKRIRKDRVTMVAFEVPVPADLPAVYPRAPVLHCRAPVLHCRAPVLHCRDPPGPPYS